MEKIVSIQVTAQPAHTQYYYYTSAATETMTDRTLAFLPEGFPNVERLLGIPWKEVRQDARALAALHPKDDQQPFDVGADIIHLGGL